ncbi:hypothetical protein JCM11491_001394 [Sporobolomyces phaffii]
MPSKAALERALERYTDSLKLKQASNLKSRSLVSLEHDSIAQVASDLRDRHALTQEGLETLMTWKLARGKWRPRLQQLVASNDAATVEDATRIDPAQFPAADFEDVKASMTRFCTLKGVGPATASAILALYDPRNEPFMSDQAMTYVGSRSDDDDADAAAARIKLEYTVKAWHRYRAQMQLRRDDEEWNTVEDLERALWSWAIQKELGKSSATGEQDTSDEASARGIGKRKATEKDKDEPIAKKASKKSKST